MDLHRILNNTASLTVSNQEENLQNVPLHPLSMQHAPPMRTFILPAIQKDGLANSQALSSSRDVAKPCSDYDGTDNKIEERMNVARLSNPSSQALVTMVPNDVMGVEFLCYPTAYEVSSELAELSHQASSDAAKEKTLTACATFEESGCAYQGRSYLDAPVSSRIRNRARSDSTQPKLLHDGNVVIDDADDFSANLASDNALQNRLKRPLVSTGPVEASAESKIVMKPNTQKQHSGRNECTQQRTRSRYGTKENPLPCRVEVVNGWVCYVRCEE